MACNFYAPEENKLAFVIRIRSINGIHPRFRMILQLFRLRQTNNGMFVRINGVTHNMLLIIDSCPPIKIVRHLLYKRFYCKNNETRQPITNDLIQRKRQRYGILCIGYLVHEAVKMQKNFKPTGASMYQPILSPGTWKSQYR
ncbi:ribosomal protein L30p/L7e [Opisthorchis viverrini]|uniref:Ribosomal protein L30p/L7e n=2 Tax=Opisthorchis viverrini TaxID=6198 RepID=A0A1S8WMT8_OPIVI|nr:hypothetical protein T265_12127 [Opisthorchis viverrini]KER18852.1 hypothetical protein T265_12127 [Opisthorchis viverrini]OON15792.1 ribosomal protein L30p/L7e [Opisthorchis viverrini]